MRCEDRRETNPKDHAPNDPRRLYRSFVELLKQEALGL